MVSKKHFCAKKFFFWLVPLVFRVGAPNIRDPSPNLGVGTPNLGVSTPHLKKIGKVGVKNKLGNFPLVEGKGGGVPTL